MQPSVPHKSFGVKAVVVRNMELATVVWVSSVLAVPAAEDRLERGTVLAMPHGMGTATGRGSTITHPRGCRCNAAASLSWGRLWGSSWDTTKLQRNPALSLGTIPGSTE